MTKDDELSQLLEAYAMSELAVLRGQLRMIADAIGFEGSIADFPGLLEHLETAISR
jgi:hypothetical protein